MGNIEKEIFSIRTRRRTIVGENNLKVFITENCKKLFGAPAKNNFTLREDLVADIPQLTQEENDILIAEFTEEEVFDAIFQMEHNKAPGLDGFPA
jgi:hypothetical protein